MCKGNGRKGNYLYISKKNSERILTSCVLKSTNYRKSIETIIRFAYNGIVKKEVIIMQVEIKIDSSYIDPRVIILTASMTEDVSNIVKKLSENASQIISGYKDEKIEILEQTDLIRIYANSGKVFAVTNKGEYILRLR